MRESVRERRTLMRIAPHLVHTLPFLLPTYRDWKRRRPVLAAALLLNDLVSFDRNHLTAPDKYIPPGRIISREECRKLFPGVLEDGLTGGAIWYDAQIYNSDRLTLSFALSASKAGAEVANYLEVTGFLRDGSRVRGVRAKDIPSGEEIDIRSRVVLNAGGPWIDRMLHLLDGERRPRLFHSSKAMNLVTRPLTKDVAVGLSGKRTHRDDDAWIGKGRRVLFIIPWRGYSLIGTSHAPYRGEADSFEASEEDIQELLDEINDAYPAARLERGDVRLVHRGLLPMVPGSHDGNGVTLVKKYRIRDHRIEGIDGLITMMGVKYTTARGVAEKAVDRVFGVLEKKAPKSRTAMTPLHGGAIESFSDFLDQEVERKPHGLNEESVRHLVQTYGSAYGEVLRYVEHDRSWAQPLVEASPVLRAEVLHAVREEQALDLASVILRRTELGSAGHPGRPCLESCAAIMAPELEWDQAKVSEEIAKVDEFYRRRS
jgi:glycerol-3-phosphate dehydrogenase